MAVINTKLIAEMLNPGMVDQIAINRAKSMQQAAEETSVALSKAKDALQTGRVTLELAKDVAPVVTQLQAVTAKLEQLDQRMQGIEKKIESSGCCSIS